MGRKLRTVLLTVLGVFLFLIVLGAVSSSLQRETVTVTLISTTTTTRYIPTVLPITITITETLTETVTKTIRETTTITKTETLTEIATIIAPTIVTTPTTTIAPGITQVIEVGLNQPATFDNLEITVYDVRVGPYIYHVNYDVFRKPIRGYKFVVIDLKFKNIGNKGMDLCDVDIWKAVLITNAGKEYTEDHSLFNTYRVYNVTEEVLSQAIPVNLKDWCFTWIDPGTSTEFPLVFEIPVDEEPVKLILYVGKMLYRVGIAPKYEIVVLLG